MELDTTKKAKNKIVKNSGQTQQIVRLILCSLLIFVMPLIGLPQKTIKKLPEVKLKDFDGKEFNISNLSNDGNPIIIVFFATWCKPCIAQLIGISENYEDWQTETGTKLVAVSLDDARNSPKVKPLVDAKGWEYEVYLDENSDSKRTLGFENIPTTFIINGKGEIVWQHNNYQPGDEEVIIEKVREVKTKNGG